MSQVIHINFSCLLSYNPLDNCYYYHKTRWFWMFTFERYNKRIKDMVKNRHWVSESIAQNALVEIAAQYLNTLEGVRPSNLSSHEFKPIERSNKVHRLLKYHIIIIVYQLIHIIDLNQTKSKCCPGFTPFGNPVSKTRSLFPGGKDHACPLSSQRVGGNYMWVRCHDMSIR